MIAFVHGTVADVTLGSAVLEVGGVGLELVCTPNTPTGGVVGHDELANFLDHVPADVVVLVEVPLELDPLEDEPPEGAGNPAGIANGSRTGGTNTGEGARLGDSLPEPPPVPPVPPGADVVDRGEKLVAASSPPPPPSSFSARKITTSTPTAIPPYFRVRLSRSLIAISARLRRTGLRAGPGARPAGGRGRRPAAGS